MAVTASGMRPLSPRLPPPVPAGNILPAGMESAVSSTSPRWDQRRERATSPAAIPTSLRLSGCQGLAGSVQSVPSGTMLPVPFPDSQFPAEVEQFGMERGPPGTPRTPRRSLHSTGVGQAGPRLSTPPRAPPVQLPAMPPDLGEADFRRPGKPLGFSASIGGEDQRRRERQQLREWAEQLYQEVARAERDRAELERQLAEEKVERIRLQSELEQQRRSFAELERLAAQGRAAGSAVGENGDLRKQLSAYAVEIEVLRKEKDNTGRTLRESQDAVLQQSQEKEGLMLTIQEHRRAHDETKKEIQGHLDRYGRLQSAHAEEKSRRQAAESRLEKELDAGDANLQVLQQRNLDEQSGIAKSLETAQRSLDHKDRHRNNLMSVVKDQRALLIELQDSYVQLTRDYRQFAQKVQAHQQHNLREMQEAEKVVVAQQEFTKQLLGQLRHGRELHAGHEQLWSEQAKQSEGELDKMNLHSRKAAETVRLSREEEAKRVDADNKRKQNEQAAVAARKQTKNARWKAISNPNMAQMMFTAVLGKQVDKITLKGHKDTRMLKVVIADGTSTLTGRSPPSFFSSMGKGSLQGLLKQKLLQSGPGDSTRLRMFFTSLGAFPQGATRAVLLGYHASSVIRLCLS